MIRMIKNPFAASAAKSIETESPEQRHCLIEGGGTG